MTERRWLGGVAAVVLVAGLAWAVQRRAQQERDTRLEALRVRWSGRATPVDWRSAPAWDGRLPTAQDAASPWNGAESVLGMVLISALRNDPRGVPAEEWDGMLELVAADQGSDVLLPVARAAVGLRRGQAPPPTGEASGTAAPWQAWLALAALQQEPGENLVDGAHALVAAWPGHPEACLVGVRWGLARGRLRAAQELGDRCDWAGASLARLRGDLLDARGDAEGAWQAWAAVGADVHAAAVACQEGLEHDRPGLDAPVPPARLHAAWCALADADADAVRRARGLLGQSPADDPPFRLARAALALWDGEPGLVDGLLGELDSARALVLRGRARAALGDRSGARAAFAAARALLPFEQAILDAWVSTLPEDGAALGDDAGGSAVILLAQSDLVGDRARPWFLVAGLGSPRACPSCGVTPGLDAARRGPGPDCAGLPQADALWCAPPLMEGPAPWRSGDGPSSGQPGDELRAIWAGSRQHPDEARARLEVLIDGHRGLRGLPRLLARLSGT